MGTSVWPWLAGGAAAGILGASQARDRAREAGQPQPYNESTTTGPWAPTDDPLRGMVPDIMELYGQQREQFASGAGRPPRRGGGGGPSQATRDLFGTFSERATAPSEMLGSTEDYITGRMTGADNRYDINSIQGNFENPFLNATFARTGAGSDPAFGYYNQFIQGLMSPGSAAPASSSGGSRAGGSYGGGVGNIGSGPKIKIGDVTGYENDYSNPELEAYLSSVLSGEFLGSNPYLEEIADRIRSKSSDAEAAAVANLTRREAGAGRFGRGRYGEERAAVSEAMNEAMTGSLAQLFGNEYEFERAQQAQAAGLISNRDIAKWNDLSQRYGIDTGKAIAEAEIEGRIRQSTIGANAQLGSARIGASASRANTADSIAAQERMHRLSTTLGAIQGLSGADLDRMGIAANLSGQWGEGQLGTMGMDLQRQMANQGTNLSADQGALGAAPGIYNTPFGPLGQAIQFSQGMDRQRGAAAGNRYQDDMNRWLYEQQRPGEILDDTINRLMGLGGSFPTSSTVGERAGQYVPAPSALEGILGGAMQGYGLYNDLFGGGGAAAAGGGLAGLGGGGAGAGFGTGVGGGAGFGTGIQGGITPGSNLSGGLPFGGGGGGGIGGGHFQNPRTGQWVPANFPGAVFTPGSGAQLAGAFNDPRGMLVQPGPGPKSPYSGA